MTRPNILLLVVDCLRADHAYDRRLSHTPALGALVDSGFSFTHAISAANCTTPSFAAVLTGQTQIENGVRCLHGDKLNADVRTLPEMLTAAGYNTYAEASGPLGPETGLDRGFQEYNHRIRQGHDSSWGQDLLKKLSGHFRPPWFLLLHVWDLHVPRWVLPECRNSRCGSSEYARALSSVDVFLSRVMESLPGDTLTVLTGDHGEDFSSGPLDRLRRALFDRILTGKLFRSLWKRNLLRRHMSEYLRNRTDDHYDALFDFLVRVPLTFHGPGIVAPGTSGLQVRHVDICPTVLELAGVAPPANLAGRSLAGIMRGEPDSHRDAYVEVGATKRRRSLPGLVLAGIRVDNRYKYICTLDGGRFGPWLYDLVDDPDERRNIAAERPELVAELQQKMKLLQEQRVSGIAMTAAETRIVHDRLKALGYE